MIRDTCASLRLAPARAVAALTLASLVVVASCLAGVAAHEHRHAQQPTHGLDVVTALRVPAARARHGSVTGRGVTVALIDTGVRRSHVAFARNDGGSDRDVIVDCQDFAAAAGASGQDRCADSEGHGTFVASLIAGRGHDGPAASRPVGAGCGSGGMSPGVGLVVLKAFAGGADANRQRSAAAPALSYTSWFVDAIDYVLTQHLALARSGRGGIQLLTLSLGSEDILDAPFNDAVLQLAAAGITVVTAAGNAHSRLTGVMNPADLIHVIAVGGLAAPAPAPAPAPLRAGRSRVARASSSGCTRREAVGRPKPDVVTFSEHLVGASIAAAHECGQRSGTSVAAPVVAGALALAFEVLQRSGVAPNPAIARQLLWESAAPLLAPDGDEGGIMLDDDDGRNEANANDNTTTHSQYAAFTKRIESSIAVTGAGALDVAALLDAAASYSRRDAAGRIAFFPTSLELVERARQLWPWSEVQLNRRAPQLAPPVLVNVTVANGNAVAATLTLVCVEVSLRGGGGGGDSAAWRRLDPARDGVTIDAVAADSGQAVELFPYFNTVTIRFAAARRRRATGGDGSGGGGDDDHVEEAGGADANEAGVGSPAAVVRGRIVFRVDTTTTTTSDGGAATHHQQQQARATSFETHLNFSVAVHDRPVRKESRLLWPVGPALQLAWPRVDAGGDGDFYNARRTHADAFDSSPDDPFCGPYSFALSELRRSGFVVDVVSVADDDVDAVFATPLELASYGALLLVDPEQYITAGAHAAIAEAVRSHGLSLVVVADWYNADIVTAFRRPNPDRHGAVDAFSAAGSNVPMLNALLGPLFGIELSASVLAQTDVGESDGGPADGASPSSSPSPTATVLTLGGVVISPVHSAGSIRRLPAADPQPSAATASAGSYYCTAVNPADPDASMFHVGLATDGAEDDDAEGTGGGRSSRRRGVVAAQLDLGLVSVSDVPLVALVDPNVLRRNHQQHQRSTHGRAAVLADSSCLSPPPPPPQHSSAPRSAPPRDGGDDDSGYTGEGGCAALLVALAEFAVTGRRGAVLGDSACHAATGRLEHDVAAAATPTAFGSMVFDDAVARAVERVVPSLLECANYRAARLPEDVDDGGVDDDAVFCRSVAAYCASDPMLRVSPALQKGFKCDRCSTKRDRQSDYDGDEEAHEADGVALDESRDWIRAMRRVWGGDDD